MNKLRKQVITIEIVKVVYFYRPFPTKIPEADDEEAQVDSNIPLILEPEVHHIWMDDVLQKLPNLNSLTINIGTIYLENCIDWRDFE